MPNLTTVYDMYLTAILKAIDYGDVQAVYIYTRMSARVATPLYKALSLKAEA